MISNLLLLIVGFILLIKGSDYLVESGSRLAKKIGVSEFVIGLTFMAIGTSIPELISNIFASVKNYNDLIIGNVFGSNIANVALVIGLVAFIYKVDPHDKALMRDTYIMFIAYFITYAFMINHIIGLFEGILLLAYYLIFILFLFTQEEIKDKWHFVSFLNYLFKFRYLITIKNIFVKKGLKSEDNAEEKKAVYLFKEGLIKDLVIFCLSLITVLYGANLLVDNAVWFADYFGLTTSFIGMTIIALGTSLPELTVTLTAAKKGFVDMIFGTIIGSNIANICLVMGVSSIISPINVNIIYLTLVFPIMIFTSFMLIIFVSSKTKYPRHIGFLLLLIYVLFISYLVYLNLF